MAYAKDDIERVRQAINLVELIGTTTTVKRTGRSFKAICPFHQEKTPSLSIDPSKGVYYCFGCGVGGDVFTYVQETQGLDFNEALEQLAAASGITLRRDPGAARRRGERTELIEAITQAVEFYVERLKSAPEAASARAYLRGRGYDSEVVDQFQIGYADTEWDSLVQHLRALDVRDRALVSGGLAHRNRRGRLIDYFHGRILFPIYDLRGDPVGFGGRKLEGEGPKYLNTPETRLYQKSRLLYGLNWAKADITRRGFALVVEGYTDVIALHLADLPTAVATCGTALGEHHFDLLRRFCDRIVLAFDADQAGAGAAMRADDLELPSDLSLDLRVAVMPADRDPADVVQDGDLDLLEKAVEDSQPLLQFRIEQELDQHTLDEPEGRARAVRSVAPLIARSPDVLARGEYAGMVARRTGVDREAVRGAVEQAARRQARRPTEPSADDESPLTGSEKAERELLRLIAANAASTPDISADLFADETNRAAFELLSGELAGLSEGESVDLGSLLEERTDEVAQHVRRLALDDRPLPEAREVVRRLERARDERRIAELRRSLEGQDPESDAYSAIWQELIDLERRKRER